MAFLLRQLRSEDTPQLASLFLEVRRATFHWRNLQSFTLDDFDVQTAGETITVAQSDDGTLLGFISVWEPDSFVHHLFVATNAQGLGVGTALLHSLQAWLPFPHRLKCSEPNKRAEAFYRKLGWVEIEKGESSDGAYLLLEFQRAAHGHPVRILEDLGIKF